jgi:ABC-2 type transport system ATP-binding protein
MDEAQALADRVAIIAAGRIVAEGAPADLAAAQRGTEIRFTLPAEVAPAELPRVSGRVATRAATLRSRPRTRPATCWRSPAGRPAAAPTWTA